jgi:uncharacterized protein YxeA
MKKIWLSVATITVIAHGTIISMNNNVPNVYNVQNAYWKQQEQVRNQQTNAATQAQVYQNYNQPVPHQIVMNMDPTARQWTEIYNRNIKK